MENRLFMFANITIAVRAKNILQTAGIRGYVQKTPKINNKTSCGYSVLLQNDYDRAQRLLQQYGFNILGVLSRDSV